MTTENLQRSIKMDKKQISKNPLEGIKIPQGSTPDSEEKNDSKKRIYKKRKTISRRYPTPRSFRINHIEIDALKEKTESVSELAGPHVKISDTLTLRALIRLSEDIPDEEVLEKIKEIKVET